MSRSAATFTRSSMRPRDRTAPGGGIGGLRRRLRRRPPASGNRKRQRNRDSRPLRRRIRRADGDRRHGDVVPCVSMPIAYTSTSVERIIGLISRTVGAAVRVVAVRDDDDRLLPMPPGLRERDRRGHRVVERRAPRGRMRASPVAMRSPIGRPSFDELRLIVEPIEKHFVVSIEQLEQEAVERLTRRHPFLALHAAARVDARARG